LIPHHHEHLAQVQEVRRRLDLNLGEERAVRPLADADDAPQPIALEHVRPILVVENDRIADLEAGAVLIVNRKVADEQVPLPIALGQDLGVATTTKSDFPSGLARVLAKPTLTRKLRSVMSCTRELVNSALATRPATPPPPMPPKTTGWPFITPSRVVPAMNRASRCAESPLVPTTENGLHSARTSPTVARSASRCWARPVDP
jgi:hypothetical protein